MFPLVPHLTKPYGSYQATAPTKPLEVRMARLEGSFEQINLRLTSLETQVSDVRSDIRSLRADVDSKFGSLRADMDGKFDGLRADMDSKFDPTDRKIDELRVSMDGKIDGLRASTESKIDGLRNFIFILFGALTALIAVFEFIN